MLVDNVGKGFFFRIPNANEPKKQSVESQLYNVRGVLEFRNGATSNAAGEAAKGYILRSNDVSMNRPWSCGCISTNCKSTLFRNCNVDGVSEFTFFRRHPSAALRQLYKGVSAKHEGYL